jgi:hypothetical protein
LKPVLLHSDNGVNGALYEWRVTRSERPGPAIGDLETIVHVKGTSQVASAHFLPGQASSRWAVKENASGAPLVWVLEGQALDPCAPAPRGTIIRAATECNLFQMVHSL